MPFYMEQQATSTSNLHLSQLRRVSCKWRKLAWAAATVGRPNLYHCMQPGWRARLEMNAKVSCILLALKQDCSTGLLCASDPYVKMMQDDRSYVTGLLGRAFCKLMADKHLCADELISIDEYWDDYIFNQGQMSRNDSRPDFLYRRRNSTSNEWYVFESKGRLPDRGKSNVTNGAVSRLASDAERQAQTVYAINGSSTIHKWISLAYFNCKEVDVFFADPSESSKKLKLEVDEKQLLWLYYRPFAELLTLRSVVEFQKDMVSIYMRDVDYFVLIDSRLAFALVERSWKALENWCNSMQDNNSKRLAPGLESDGLGIRLGHSWNKTHFDDDHIE